MNKLTQYELEEYRINIDFMSSFNIKLDFDNLKYFNKYAREQTYLIQWLAAKYQFNPEEYTINYDNGNIEKNIEINKELV